MAYKFFVHRSKITPELLESSKRFTTDVDLYIKHCIENNHISRTNRNTLIVIETEDKTEFERLRDNAIKILSNRRANVS